MDVKSLPIFGVPGESSGASSSLSALFSDESQQKFSRVVRQTVISRKKAEPVAETELPAKRVKKPKHKAKSIDSNNENIAAVSSAASSSSSLEDTSETDNFELRDDKRTIFVGNIPLTETTKSIRKVFQEFGEVSSVRFRSVPIAGTAVDDAGNQNLVKKVCSNSRKFGDQKGSFNAYIVFKTEESVEKSLSANNQLIGKRHIRVDKVPPSLFDPKRSVFVGSLSYYSDEEALREHFSKVLPAGQDDIESIRVIRDPETQLCKGIAYILFKSRDCVLKALELNQAKFKKRELRVTVCGKRTKRQAAAATANANAKEEKNRSLLSVAPSSGGTEEDAGGENGGSTSAPDGVNTTHSKKRKFEKKNDSIHANNAVKRIKLKSVQTKKKVLLERKQKKAVPGRKGKRLGGVVKRAMKAAKTKAV